MRKSLFTAALGLAALFASAGAGAKEVDGWDAAPFDAGNGCYVAKFVSDDVMVGFHYLPETREFRVVASSPNWDALATNGDQKGPVELRLVTPAGPRNLSTNEGHILKLNGGHEALAAIWYGDGGVMVRDTLGKASAITISFKGEEIGTYPLSATSRAINALMVCAAGIGRT